MIVRGRLVRSFLTTRSIAAKTFRLYPTHQTQLVSSTVEVASCRPANQPTDHESDNDESDIWHSTLDFLIF